MHRHPTSARSGHADRRAEREAARPRRPRRLRAPAAAAVLAGALGGVTPTSAGIGSGPRAVFVPIAPCRLVDTRPAPETVGARAGEIGPGEVHTVTVTGRSGNCDIPADATAISMNVAVVDPTAASYLTVFPAGGSPPLAANLNWSAGDPPRSNAATVAVGAGGGISLYNLAGRVHVTVDVNGWYVDHHHDDRYQREASGGPLPDHHHDDRYARSSRTLVVSGFAVQLLGRSTLGGAGFCAVNASPANSSDPGQPTQPSNTYGLVPLDVPLGSRITGVRVTMLDVDSKEAYAVQLQRRTTGPGVSAMVPLGSAVGGPATATVVHHLGPATAETVDAHESFVVWVDLGSGTGANGICRVEVDLVDPA